jgi:regulator of protease activity HflC (stomatin/prohibitin superfamily)
MKKSLFVISTVFIFGIMVMGCATKGDLEKAQAQEQQTNMKADEAIKAAQEAKDAAAKANDAAAQAQQTAQAAEARADAAEAANAAFKASMKK